MVEERDLRRTECEHALAEFNRICRTELDRCLEPYSQEPYFQAAALIAACRRKGGRIHATGIGKPAHLCGYAASLLSSTGTPTYYLHGTEAVHGSCGQLVEGDVVICISNSGETAELKATVQAVRENGGRIVAITGNPASWLAKNADVHLFAGVSQEGDSLNRAPRLSVLAEMMVLQRLSIVLQADYGLTSTLYVRWHPAGRLGQLREDER